MINAAKDFQSRYNEKTEMIFATKPPAGSVTYAYFNAPPTLANLSFSGPVQGFDYYGNDIAENGTIGFFETTASGCANICNAHSNSVGFVYFAENFVGNIYGSYGVVNWLVIPAGHCYPNPPWVHSMNIPLQRRSMLIEALRGFRLWVPTPPRSIVRPFLHFCLVCPFDGQTISLFPTDIAVQGKNSFRDLVLDCGCELTACL